MSRVLPILFNTDMVRAILDGRKTCTRRIIKAEKVDNVLNSPARKSNPDIPDAQFIKCLVDMKYEPGDILYVRETWERFECWNCEGDNNGNCPKNPQESVLNRTCGCYMYRATDEIRGDAKWHPSIHMPKEAARIWLKVTDVRVERLNEITDKGAEREGAQPDYPFDYDVDKWPNLEHFKKIWNSTIKKPDIDRYGWDANPYVWVVEFERCEKPACMR